MVLVQLGALRFAGLFSDFGSLPLDANLNGAIFDAVDTVQKWVFDGTAWTEFLGDTSGEDNTGDNVGVGTGLIFRDKMGVVLNFKSLIGGTNITVTDNADDITLSSTGTSPLTTKGDMLGFTTVDARLPVGTDGQVLSANSVQGIGLEWIDAPSSSPLTTKGDLVAFSTLDVRLPVGTDEQVLTADATAVEGVRWKDAAGGGGGITGLEPNSTILEYSTELTDYTTPNSATATSESASPINIDNGGDTSNGAGFNGLVMVTKFTGLTAGVLITEVNSKIQVAAGNIRAHVYDSIAGIPTNLLAESDSQAVTASAGGIEVVPLLSNAVVPSNGEVWVGHQVSSASCDVFFGLGTIERKDDSHAFGSAPDPFSQTGTNNNGIFVQLTLTTGAADAIDGDTATFWASDAGINESITLDMGSLQNCYGLAYYIDKVQSGITETQFQIKSTSLVENNDLKAYYQFDEVSGDLINQSTSAVTLGSAADGTVTATQNVAGLIDRAYSFDGVADKVLLGSSLSQFNFMHNGTTPWTFLTWIKRQETGNGEIFDTNDRSNSVVGIGIGFNVSGDNVFCQVTNGSGNVVNFGSTTTITNDGNWHMVAVQFDGVTTYSIEIDDDGTIDTASAALAESASDAGFIAHVATIAAEDNAWLNGDLDEMSIWERQLSGAELESFYNAGLGRVIAQDTNEQILRTVQVADLVDQTYNYIRFNGVNTQLIRIEGSSGSSLVMAANELAVQVETDPPLTTLHGQFTINGTDANLPLNGGDPTSTVIDDPQINTLTFNNVGTPNDPAAGKAVLWIETVDANNDGIFAKIKVDGTFKTVRVI